MCAYCLADDMKKKDWKCMTAKTLPPTLPPTKTPQSLPIRRSERLSNKEGFLSAAPSVNEVDESSEGGVPCAAPSDEVEEDQDDDDPCGDEDDDRDDDEDHESNDRENEDEGSSKGGVPCAAPLDDHFFLNMNEDNNNDHEDVIDNDRTIRNDEVSIVPVKDIDILTKRKNSVDKMEYKNLGGNIWLKKLCQDNLEEYYNIVGNHSNLRKDIILTTIINQLANENRRVLQIRNGEWTQMKEQEVKRHIQNAMNAARINECHGSCC
jgi:hypothetical protein